MSRMTSNHHSYRVTFKRASLCVGALLLLTLLSLNRASAQNSAGPLPGATPSDQPAAQAKSSSQVAGKPNLAGTWKLNVDQSDNPMQKMRQAQQDSGDQGGGGGRRGGGYGGGGGMGGPGGGWGGQNGGGQNAGDGDQQGGEAGGQQGGGGRRQGGGGMRGMATLVIEQTPTSAKVSDLSGRVLALYSASPESSPASSANSANDGRGPAPAVAQWQDNKLVATQQMRNGGTTTRSYELSSDNKQLIVTTKIENKRFKEPVTFKQVYDPVYASTGGD